MNCGIVSLCAGILTSQKDFGIISATFVSYLFTYCVRFFPLSELEVEGSLFQHTGADITCIKEFQVQQDRMRLLQSDLKIAAMLKILWW